jgi:RNA polymerase sigma factor (TIGR02999 family)
MFRFTSGRQALSVAFKLSAVTLRLYLSSMSDVTCLIDAAAAGDRHAADELLPLVYDELRTLAAARLASEAPGHTLQSTALVHEAYLRLIGGGQPIDWDGRGHFFAAAAEAMRRILIDRARHKATAKKGGDLRRIDIEQVSVADEGREAELLAQPSCSPWMML